MKFVNELSGKLVDVCIDYPYQFDDKVSSSNYDDFYDHYDFDELHVIYIGENDEIMIVEKYNDDVEDVERYLKDVLMYRNDHAIIESKNNVKKLGLKIASFNGLKKIEVG